ncbi:MAG: ABC transporter ATP-binding protein [Phycisphaerales bacterium]|nr:ABC transporter ATP-binding protein [Phycisphaerales bacterium]
MVQTSVQQKSAPTVVAVQGLTKTFKDFWMRTRARAVDGVSFEVRHGEIFGLLGPNGSGKSTTIKIILGLLKQTSGRVAIFGKSPSDVAIKKKIGYLPEESYLYPFLNARETLEYYAKLFQLDPRTRKSRIDALLDMVGLTGVQFRQVREYSKGMQRRIGLAQALINDPDLLILDEPTTGLDPIGTRQVKDLILELGRRKKTIILSSHLLADVEYCVDRMVILYGGKIREEGTCDEILTAEDRSLIETEPLDEGTIEAIDKLIRERTGGRQSINRVSKGRQKLEEKFVKIVERAMQERVETSGARHGGQTAGFLRATGANEVEAPKGEQLISQLVQNTKEEDAAKWARLKGEQEAATAQSKATGPDASLIGQLVSGGGTGESGGGSTPAAGVPSSGGGSSAATPAAKKPEVDQSVIDSLLGGGGDEAGKGKA